MEVGKLLQNVADEMLEGLQVVSPEWRYLYVNETVARQGKREKSDLLGRTMMECYPGIEETDMFREIEKCMETRSSVAMENEFAFPDGTKGWFQLRMHRVAEGVAILSIDIGERKRVEAELFEKIEELNAMTDVTVMREIKMAELKSSLVTLKALAPAPRPSVTVLK